MNLRHVPVEGKTAALRLPVATIHRFRGHTFIEVDPCPLCGRWHTYFPGDVGGDISVGRVVTLRKVCKSEPGSYRCPDRDEPTEFQAVLMEKEAA
jgi:hypothetical protein